MENMLFPDIKIGDNGNWFIGETDTLVPATGPKGDKGEKVTREDRVR